MTRLLSVFLFCLGLFCLAQAQTPTTHAGLGAPGVASGGGGGGAVAPAFGWQNIMSNGFVGAGTSITLGVSSPATACGTISVGDLLLGGVVVEAAGVTIAPTSGWTTIGTQSTSAGNFTYKAAFKIATSGDTTSFCNTTGYVWTWTGSNFAAWWMMDYTGVNSAPLDGTPTTAIYATGATSNIVMLGLTTTAAPDTLIASIYGDQNSLTYTCPSGYTQRANANQESTTVQLLLCDTTLPTAGLVGSQTATVSGTLRTGSYALFAITHP